MILRRLTQHIKSQNWFAVVLDFIIVVVGVGVALMAQQALNDYQSLKNYNRAVVDLRNDIANVYDTAKERLAVAECRKTRYREIGELLMQTDTPWVGSPREYGTEDSLTSVFPKVTRSPIRLWTSALWNAELSKGTFDLMDEENRLELSQFFSMGLKSESMQDEIFDMEANLQALAYPLNLNMSDRLRYFDLLTRADAASGLLELNAMQSIEGFERTGFLTPLNTDETTERRQELEQRNARLSNIYGECVKQMVYPHLESNTKIKGETP